MRLYLIRHAESENNALSRESLHRRKVDPDLTPLGYQQRDLLARHIEAEMDAVGEGYAITHLYTSAMYRSLLTAKPVSDALAVAPTVWPDLHEKGGMYSERDGCVRGHTGMTRADIQAAFPGFCLPDTIGERGWYDTSLGMEPEEHCYYRAIKVARELRARGDTDDVIALVSHAGFLDVLLKAIFEQLPSRPYTMHFYHDNTAITRINFHQGWTTLHYLNRVDHLMPDLRSF